MMSSQLSRMILDASGGTGDEMRATPVPDDHLDPLEGLLDDVALQAVSRPGRRGNRRPESSSSTE